MPWTTARRLMSSPSRSPYLRILATLSPLAASLVFGTCSDQTGPGQPVPGQIGRAHV